MLDTKELSRNAYAGVEFDSDEMIEQIFEKSADLDLDEPRGHVMNKEEFMMKVRAHCAERDKRKAQIAKAQQDDFKAYKIERAFYRRRIAINSRRK